MAEAARRTGPRDIGHPLLGYDERPGNAAFMREGHVPNDPSATLEYGVADFGIAQLASRLGDRATAAEFMRRAQAWQHIYNPGTGWIQPRQGDGAFTSPFDPASPDVYMEGNGAQYHWMVPHNPAGLFTAMGGPREVVPRLDTYFAKLNAGPAEAHAYLGNEVALPSPWLYAWTGQPYKTQALVRRVQQELFKPGPDGLVGNDDLGAMGSWYVWSAMGLFPAIPGRAELLVNTPLFERITIDRPGGDIVVDARGAGPYIRSLRVNGAATDRAWLPESFATGGGRLDFVRGTSPDRDFGADPEDAPPSFGGGTKPYLAGFSRGSGPVEPGGALATELAVRSLGQAATVTWEARPPAGVTVSPARGTLSLAAGGQARQAVEISVSGDVPRGVLTVPVVVGELTASVRLNVAARGTPEWHHNNAGIGDADAPGEANIDGAGLQPLGAGPGRGGTHPGRPGQVAGLHLHLAGQEARRMGQRSHRRGTAGGGRAGRRHPPVLPGNGRERLAGGGRHRHLHRRHDQLGQARLQRLDPGLRVGRTAVRQRGRGQDPAPVVLGLMGLPARARPRLRLAAHRPGPGQEGAEPDVLHPA
ncbi:hypothetical protein GCM10020219_036520 [Nonomuraea dietziae]